MSTPFKIPQTETATTVTALIKKHCSPAAIYAFGYKTESCSAQNAFHPEGMTENTTQHYYIVAFAKSFNPNAAADTAEIIRTETGATVTLLLHSLKSLKQKPGAQQYFFHSILTQSQLLYCGSPTPPFLHGNPIPEKHSEATNRYASQRLETASALLDNAANTDTDRVGQVKAIMLHLAAEQICLALIRTLLGYRPNHHALGFLTDLCGLFTPLAREIFPRHTREDKALFKLLCTSQTDLRLKKPDYIDTLGIEILERRCSLFLTEARILIENQTKAQLQ